MGISIIEFKTALEVYGAKRLADCIGSRYNFMVPCFKVEDTTFLHSGSYYIVQRGAIVSDKLMKEAMAKLGEKYPGGNNYWYDEIHSVRGILTLVSMLEGKYDKELVEKLTAETYQKILQHPSLQKSLPSQFDEFPEDWKTLTDLVKELDHIANPFVNSSYKLKDPIHYLSKLTMSIGSGKTSFRLKIENSNTSVEFSVDNNGIYYSIFISNPSGSKKPEGWLNVGHYNKPSFSDEIIYLDYCPKGGYSHTDDDFDLRVNLHNKLAWQTYHENRIKPITKKQISVMTNLFQRAIETAKAEILSYMVE